MLMMVSSPMVDYGGRDTVQNHEAIPPIFHVTTGNDENRRVQLGNFDLPIPTQTANFAVSASSIDGKERHFLQMLRQLLKELRLLPPTERIGLSLGSVGRKADLRWHYQPRQAILIDPYRSKPNLQFGG